MSRFRCKTCGHRPRRIVSAFIRDPKMRELGERRQHKKPCACLCHLGGTAASYDSDQAFLDSL